MCLFLFQWLENDFLTYLRVCASTRPGFKPAQKRAMTLSRETIDGLRMTGELIMLVAITIHNLPTSFFSALNC